MLIQLRELLDTNPSVVSVEHRQKAITLFTSLSDSTVTSVFGGTVYDTAKTNILSWFTPQSREAASKLFLEFERANGRQDEMKPLLDQVFTLAAEEKANGNIDDIDFADIQRNLCDIVIYYDLPSKTCGTISDEQVVTEEVVTS
ncbi:MAG: hypothetical protein H6765_04810 [Candidatus Peribacteria bacterium]|nr:MAG: hypothetical protein H6765_04810 [Candidatus Peribacteria bacterium]